MLAPNPFFLLKNVPARDHEDIIKAPLLLFVLMHAYAFKDVYIRRLTNRISPALLLSHAFNCLIKHSLLVLVIAETCKASPH